MDYVVCPRCGRKMREIRRLGILFCDNDGYILNLEDAQGNGLVRSEEIVVEHK